MLGRNMRAIEYNSMENNSMKPRQKIKRPKRFNSPSRILPFDIHYSVSAIASGVTDIALEILAGHNPATASTRSISLTALSGELGI